MIFVRAPASPRTDEAPRCTESYAAPVLDTAVGGIALMSGLAGLGATLGCSPHCAENVGPGLALVSGLVLLATVPSAIRGYRAVGSCREPVDSWCESHPCGAGPTGGEAGQRIRLDAVARDASAARTQER